MKNILLTVLFSGGSLFPPAKELKAQFALAAIIHTAVKKVLVATDLEIQRIQTRTIWLQQAEKILENEMTKTRLAQIAGWTWRQEALFQEYYGELTRIKAGIAHYHRLADVFTDQEQLLRESSAALRLFVGENNFSAAEKQEIRKVYTGILQATNKDLDQLYLLLTASLTRMGDAQRLELLDATLKSLEQRSSDLREFTRENIILQLQRKNDFQSIQELRRSYQSPYHP